MCAWCWESTRKMFNVEKVGETVLIVKKISECVQSDE